MQRVTRSAVLDATVPLQRYVATLQLKPVTDGNRTFWHWQSTFDTPPGREAELADMVGRGVYEAGFEALRRHLRQGSDRQPRPAAGATRAGEGRGGEMMGQAVILKAFGGSDQLSFDNIAVPVPGPREVRIRQAAAGVNYIDVYVARGEYRMLEPPAPLGMEAAGTVLDVGAEVHDLLPGDS